MEYQREIEKFPESLAKLNAEINETKEANALVSATLCAIFADKKYINEIMRKKEEEEEAQQEQDVDSGEQEDYEEEDGEDGQQQ